MIERALEEIRAFYRKYYDHLPAVAQDDIRIELNDVVHKWDDVFHLQERVHRWELEYLRRQTAQRGEDR